MLLFTLARGRLRSFSPVRLLVVMLALAAPHLVRAQGHAAMSGTVASPNHGAVEFATITLHRAADTVVVKTEFSNAKGIFQLDAPAGARYLVSVAQVGFERFWSAPFELPPSGLVLPGITLSSSRATALKEVTVTARKPQFEHLADRTIINVADSPLSAGGTTLDVLTRAPGVTAAGSDDLALRGRTGVLVIIDGKRVPLSGVELADYLKALPAEQLQSIELITSPPAQYDAQGGAGVIAINLKKDQRLGTNGSANLNYGRSEYGKFTGGLALNHRRRNLNAYGNYTYANRRYFTRVDFSRQYLATPQLPAASSQLANDQLSNLSSHTGKVGLDLTLSKRTQIGASLTGLVSQIDNTVNNQTQLWGAGGTLTDRYTSIVAQDINRPSGSANFNLRHTMADSATAAAVSVDADYARYHTTRLLSLNTYFTEPVRPGTLLNGDQRSNLSIGALKADFSQPLPYYMRLEAGAKATHVQSDSRVAFFNTTNSLTSFNALLSNDFRYTENINAGYFNLRGAVAKTTIQAGLRAEQTNTLAELSGENSRERHYLQLFPSVSVQRALSERQALSLSVARRIDRPTYLQVNSLRAYSDATSYRAGNPNLVPATSYNFELTHTFRQKFTSTLAYALTSLPLVNVVQPAPDGGRLVVNQDVNLSKQHFYSLTLTAPLELAKSWTLYVNGLVYYNRYVGLLNGTNLDRGQTAFNLTANNTFTLPHGWSADLNGLYESREVYGFQSVSQRGQVALGFQKSLWNKQGTFRLNVTDIFYTTPIRATSSYDNFTETFYKREDLRVATMAFTYRFGNSKVAAVRWRASGADEELRRATGQ